MTTKIAIISDIHIKNNKTRQEYVEYFDLIDQELSKLDLDYILFCGDLGHSKSVLSPDSIFLSKLIINICVKNCKLKFIMIPGNHDCNERSVQRLDAISAILYEMNMDKIYYTKESSVYNQDIFSFYCMSLLDKESWPELINLAKCDSNIKICLYHGPLQGAKTDLGFTFTKAEDVSKYKDFDFMFCGDIHSHYNYGNDKFISVGNPIQQDFGESLTKGFIYYEIDDKSNYKKEFIHIKNIYPYFNLNVDDQIPLEDFRKCKIRLFLSEDYQKNIEYTTFLNKKLKGKISNIIPIKYLSETDNKEKSKKTETIKYSSFIEKDKDKKELQELYEKYIKLIDSNSDNLKWKIKTLKWSNLFSYGEDNEFDFSDMENKCIGIFGKNYSGKTSFIDVICFALFGSWTKSFVKAQEYINKNKKYASSEVILSIDSEEFLISRKIERNGKNIKSTLEFKNITTDRLLVADSTKDTQKEIEKIIGTKDIFLLTSLSTQFNNFSLLDELNTKRKEYFSYFLGVNKYNDIYKLAKKDLDDLSTKYDNISSFENLQEKYVKLSLEKEKVEHQIIFKNEAIRRIKEYELYDDKFITQIKEFELSINKADNEIEYIKKKIESNKNKLEKYKVKDLKNFNQERYDSCKNDLMRIQDTIQEQFFEIEVRKNELKRSLEQIEEYNSNKELLSTVPCGNAYPQCKFICKSAKYNSEIQIDVTKNHQSFLQDSIANLSIEYNKNLSLAKKYEDEIFTLKQNDNRNDIIEFDFYIGENRNLQIDLDKINLEKQIINANYEILKFTKKSGLSYNDIMTKWNNDKTEINKYKIEIEYLEKTVKDKQNEIKTLADKINKLDYLKKEIYYLEKFCLTVGKNGISVLILKDYIPYINNLVNKIMSNYVDFQVEIKIDEEKYLEIYIINKDTKTLIESASGSQKTIVSYALRLSLLYYSQIPISNVFILDEPATSFDDEHIENFYHFLSSLKINDQIVILVTHINLLKDYVDTSFIVEKEDNYSKIIS